MDIWATDKLALFLSFVIPGFISLKAYAVLGLQSPRDSTQQIVDAVTYSCLNYALLSWPILEVEASDWKMTNRSFYFAFYGAVLLVAPVIWALLWRWLRTTQVLQNILPHPTDKPWDYVFRRRLPYWMIVTFKDGKRIAGLYGSASFSSASPAAEQLYIEEAWVLNEDGGFERPRTDTAGILALGSEIATVELFHILKGEKSDNKTNSTKTGKEGLATIPDKAAGE